MDASFFRAYHAGGQAQSQGEREAASRRSDLVTHFRRSGHV